MMTCIYYVQGYFYRAEALKGLLSRPQDDHHQKTYKDVIQDYVKCQKLQPNVDALHNAVVLGVQHSEFFSAVLICMPLSNI